MRMISFLNYTGWLAFFAATALFADPASEQTDNAPLSNATSSTAPATALQKTIVFTPPAGWHSTDSKDLLGSVKVMVVGKGEHEFPPSINLGTETYKGTLKQYLKRIKEINASQGHEWKDLGTIRTPAGEASLSQADTKTKWGEVRMMHVILRKDNTVYILTAASLKEEFPKFYKDFFAAFRSLRFNETGNSP